MPQPKSARLAVAKRQSLNEAWRLTLRRSNRATWEKVGPDGYSVSDIQRNLDTHLRELEREIQRDYEFGPLKASFLPKPNGKDRIICVPSIRDRIVQRSILAYLGRKDLCRIVNDISFGYVSDENKTQKKAAEKAAAYRDVHPWTLKTDISAFFDRIPRDLLKEEIRRKVPKPSLHRMLQSAVDSEIREPKKKRRQKIKEAGIVEGIGIRQGMPLCPFFANLYLNDLDRKIQKSSGRHAIRYADDLIFFFTAESQAKAYLDWLVAELGELKLEVPPLEENGKTRIVGPGEPIEFLGAEIRLGTDGKYHPHASDDLFQSIYQRYTSLSSAEGMRNDHTTLFKLKQRLTGLTTSLSDAYGHCHNHAELVERMQGWEHGAIRRVLGREFGIEIDSLNDHQRFILDLPLQGEQEDAP